TKEQIKYHQKHRGAVLCMALHGEKHLLATGGADDQIVVWDYQAKTPDTEFLSLGNRRHQMDVLAVVFDKSGKRLVSTGVDKVAFIWELGQEKEPIALKGHTGTINAAAWSGGEQEWIATASQDGTVRIWNAKNGKLIGVHKCPDPMYAVVFRGNNH